MRVMLDLETLGTRPGSVIATIGAVKFTETEVFDSFYRRVNIDSAVAAGMRMDPDTVLWWMQQSPEAKAEITTKEDRVSIRKALEEFKGWLGGPGPTEVWGNGAAFDNALLLEAYALLGLPRPWPHKADRCYRTAKALWGHRAAFERQGTHHHALNDAASQAAHLIKLGL